MSECTPTPYAPKASPFAKRQAPYAPKASPFAIDAFCPVLLQEDRYAILLEDGNQIAL